MSGIMKIAFWVTVAGQIALLLAFIAVKENTLRTGTSVVLQTMPIDPRSLLQGDYAILDYEIATLPMSQRMLDTPIGADVYVRLNRSGGEVWRADGYFFDKPSGTQVFIKGTVKSRGRLDLGIGTYFVPEGTGHIIERARDVKVRAVVGSSGSAVIEELLVDGVPFDPRRDVGPPPVPPEPVEPAGPPVIAPPP